MKPRDLLYQALLAAHGSVALVKRIASEAKEDRAAVMAAEMEEAIKLLLDDAWEESEPEPEEKPEDPPTPSEPEDKEKPAPAPEPEKNEWPEAEDEEGPVYVKNEDPYPTSSVQVPYSGDINDTGQLNDWERGMAESYQTRGMAISSYRERTGKSHDEAKQVVKAYLASAENK